jgi:hypothetical protein
MGFNPDTHQSSEKDIRHSTDFVDLYKLKQPSKRVNGQLHRLKRDILTR